MHKLHIDKIWNSSILKLAVTCFSFPYVTLDFLFCLNAIIIRNSEHAREYDNYYHNPGIKKLFIAVLFPWKSINYCFDLSVP